MLPGNRPGAVTAARSLAAGGARGSHRFAPFKAVRYHADTSQSQSFSFSVY